MIIPINLCAPSSQKSDRFPPQLAKLGTDEVVLLELQGSFHVEGDQSGQMVARLQMHDENAKPTLRVGHHLLEGKVVNLSKPLAILVKTSPGKAAVMDTKSSEMQEDTSTEVSYDVLAVVKRKLLFSKRPIPIVGQSNSLQISK